MCDYQYHNEALRKARIIQRKHEALAKIGETQNTSGNGTGRQPQQDDRYGSGHGGYGLKGREQQYCQDSDQTRKWSAQSGAGGYDSFKVPERANNTSSGRMYQGIYKDIKRQEKTLRNNNLVMGPMESFEDYFDPNACKPSYKSY